uniref:Uncharacterized protein n=1 Tax=Nelumbo nucifera TaxID=4432 RepID=A0A822ZEG2_NELNU|nr:TPA_asm: hypothetical protein HUJ06_001507 [Nelumbo nucifera]
MGIKKFKFYFPFIFILGPLPSPDIFGKSLYTLYIGQNDFTSNLKSIGIAGVKEYLPQVVAQIAATVQVKAQKYHLGLTKVPKIRVYQCHLDASSHDQQQFT